MTGADMLGLLTHHHLRGLSLQKLLLLPGLLCPLTLTAPEASICRSGHSYGRLQSVGFNAATLIQLTGSRLRWQLNLFAARWKRCEFHACFQSSCRDQTSMPPAQLICIIKPEGIMAMLVLIFTVLKILMCLLLKGSLWHWRMRFWLSSILPFLSRHFCGSLAPQKYNALLKELSSRICELQSTRCYSVESQYQLWKRSLLISWRVDVGKQSLVTLFSAQGCVLGETRVITRTETNCGLWAPRVMRDGKHGSAGCGSTLAELIVRMKLIAHSPTALLIYACMCGATQLVTLEHHWSKRRSHLTPTVIAMAGSWHRTVVGFGSSFVELG
jgi:hypothetical protein